MQNVFFHADWTLKGSLFKTVVRKITQWASGGSTEHVATLLKGGATPVDYYNNYTKRMESTEKGKWYYTEMTHEGFAITPKKDRENYLKKTYKGKLSFYEIKKITTKDAWEDVKNMQANNYSYTTLFAGLSAIWQPLNMLLVNKFPNAIKNTTFCSPYSYISTYKLSQNFRNYVEENHYLKFNFQTKKGFSGLKKHAMLLDPVDFLAEHKEAGIAETNTVYF